MVFTEPSAVLTTKEVCQSVTSDISIWPRKLSFYFTVFALTENSTLMEGPQSSAIGKKLYLIISLYGKYISFFYHYQGL